MSAVVTRGFMHSPSLAVHSRKGATRAFIRHSFGRIGQGLAALVSQSPSRAAQRAGQDAATGLHIAFIKPRRTTFQGEF